MRDQVRSTNVVALPPSGEDPSVVVAIPYDTGVSPGVDGEHIGLFLELARSLNVAAPDHRVAFVAMGAESAERRGSRRLTQYLLDEGWTVRIFSIAPDIPEDQDALSAAGFDHDPIYGSVRDVASELFPILLGTRS